MKLKKLIYIVYSVLAILGIMLFMLTQLNYNNIVNQTLYNLTLQIERLSLTKKEIDVQYILNSSVMISDIKGSGSGTVIKKTDNAMYILTCHHVVEGTVELNETVPKEWQLGVTVGYVKLDDNYKVISKILYGAEIIKYDEDVDLALIKIGTVDKNLQVVNIAENEPVKGDILYSVGNPLGTIRTISKGILANTIEMYYIFEGVTTYGNSGGGLYNIDNELVGVPARVSVYGNIFSSSPESSLGMSINLITIKDFLKGVEF